MMSARAANSGGSVQTGGVAGPITAEMLEDAERLLSDKKAWHEFLRPGLEAREEWDNYPGIVAEALEWMASAAVDVLDIASVGPLTPVCKAFTALIEAAEGAAEVAKQLEKLVCWCAFLVRVFIERGKQPVNLTPIEAPLNKFVSTTNRLAERARVLAGRSMCMAFACHRRDGDTVHRFEKDLRLIWDDIQGVTVLDTQRILVQLVETFLPRPPPIAAEAPTMALRLPSRYYVKRVSLVSEVVNNLTASDAARAPYVLVGLGGEGKTLLASAVVRNRKIREGFHKGIFWARVGRGGKHQLQVLFEGLAREACAAETAPHRFKSADDVIRHLTQAVAKDSLPRLVVLDDVWDREVVDTLQPAGLQLLVTTRCNSLVGAGGRCTTVGNMDGGQALELLKKRSGAVKLPETEANQVAQDCGWHALTVAIAASLPRVTTDPNSASTWSNLHSDMAKWKPSSPGPQTTAGIGDDSIKRSLFPVLDMSLESLGRDEKHKFLSLAVLTHGVVVPDSMLASLWEKDRRGARSEADFLVRKSLLQEGDASFRLHDLVFEFIRLRCQGEDAVIQEAVKRQTQYLGRLAVLRGYFDTGKFLGGVYSLIGLWQTVIELTGNEQLEVKAYHDSLGVLGEDKSTDSADIHLVVANLFRIQGKHAEAMPLVEKARGIRIEKLGGTHEDTVGAQELLEDLRKTLVAP